LAVEFREVEKLRSAYAAAGQAHVFTFWKDLPEGQQQLLLDDLRCVHIDQVPGLAKLARAGANPTTSTDDLQPAEVIRLEDIGVGVREQGEELLVAGRVAAFTVAGGQGTRLGFDGPKGAFPISPVKNKPLFQLFAEFILGIQRRYGRPVPWYIMTSPGNDAATRAFFESQAYFGLAPNGVTFFQQGVIPAFDNEGRILLDQPHRLALSPDGHGGSLLAMATSGVLRDMADRGVEYISYFQVDNPLVKCLDPVFLGLHADRGADMSSKTLPKADDLEKVGNFAMSGGRQVVIEYSDLPAAVARARNPDGSRKFDAANIAIHVLSRMFVERLTADRSSFALPWHVAKKKVPSIDLGTGRRIEPAEPNGVKLEAFIFDALPLAKNPVLLATTREEEFSPVKNQAGADSVDTARRDMSRRAARWLESAGVNVLRGIASETPVVCEISPLAALDAEHLAERVVSGDVRMSNPEEAAGVFVEAEPCH